jgi:hypothetical protein
MVAAKSATLTMRGETANRAGKPEVPLPKAVSDLKLIQCGLDKFDLVSNFPSDGILVHDLGPAVITGEHDLKVGLELSCRDVMLMPAHRAGDVSAVVTHLPGPSVSEITGADLKHEHRAPPAQFRRGQNRPAIEAALIRDLRVSAPTRRPPCWLIDGPGRNPGVLHSRLGCANAQSPVWISKDRRSAPRAIKLDLPLSLDLANPDNVSSPAVWAGNLISVTRHIDRSGAMTNSSALRCTVTNSSILSIDWGLNDAA